MDYLKIFDHVLKTSLVGTILVISILILRMILKNHMKKSIIYYIWIILILKLLIPFAPESNFSIFNIVSTLSKEETNLIGETIQKSTINYINNISNTPTINLPTQNNEITNSSIENTDENEINSSIKLKEMLNIIWVVGVSIILFKSIISYIKLKINILKEYKQYKNYGFNINIKEELNFLSINKNIQVIVTNEISSPSLCGIINPKILIPLRLVNYIDNKEIRYIIIHELCHYKRKDILVTWISLLARAVHWFNPIIHLGINIMRSDCEAACDEMVLSKLDESENIYYGNTIINVLQFINVKNIIPGTTSMINDKKRLKDRIKAIAQNKKFGVKTLILGSLFIVILASLFLTNKVESRKLNSIDSSNIKTITIGVMPSPPKEKIIDNKDDINKIVKYLNSLKIKEKKQELYKGWEIKIDIVGEENYNISFIGEYITVNGTEYEINKDEKEKLRSLYNSLNYNETDIIKNDENNLKTEEQKRSISKGYQEFVDNVHADNYSIITNSSFGGPIALPGIIDTSSVLYDGFNKSKENGYDLTPYLGKSAEAYSFSLENSEGLQQVLGVVCEDKLVAYWLSPIFTSKGNSEINKILNELKY